MSVELTTFGCGMVVCVSAIIVSFNSHKITSWFDTLFVKSTYRQWVMMGKPKVEMKRHLWMGGPVHNTNSSVTEWWNKTFPNNAKGKAYCGMGCDKCITPLVHGADICITRCRNFIDERNCDLGIDVGVCVRVDEKLDVIHHYGKTFVKDDIIKEKK